MSEPIRILHVIGKMNCGGAETMIMNFFRNIDREKVQFDFVVHTDEKCFYDDEIIKLGGRIYRVPEYKVINGISYRKAWSEFLKEYKNEYKVLHGHIGSAAPIYLDIAKKNGLYTIAHSHGIDNKLFQILTYRIRNLADYFFACSIDAGISRFGNKAVSNTSVFEVLNNGISAEKYAFNENVRNECRKKLGVEEKLVIGHVGRFVWEKNHQFLIDVFKEIHSICPDSVLLLVGEGSLEDEIRNLVATKLIEDSVIFMGVRSDVPQIMQAMDGFVFPSKSEGLGIVVIEAQASGLPCLVSTALPKEVYITDLIKDMAFEKSPCDWAKEIVTMIENSKRRNTLEEIDSAGFTIKNLANKLQDFYMKSNNIKL